MAMLPAGSRRQWRLTCDDVEVVDHGPVRRAVEDFVGPGFAVPVGFSGAGCPGVASPGPRQANTRHNPYPAADFESLRVVIPAMTGFLARNNDQHPGSRLSCPVYPDRAGGRGLLAAQPDAFLQPLIV